MHMNRCCDAATQCFASERRKIARLAGRPWQGLSLLAAGCLVKTLDSADFFGCNSPEESISPREKVSLEEKRIPVNKFSQSLP